MPYNINPDDEFKFILYFLSPCSVFSMHTGLLTFSQTDQSWLLLKTLILVVPPACKLFPEYMPFQLLHLCQVCQKKRERKKLIRLHYRLGTLKLENLNPLYQQQVCPKLSLDGDVIYIILDNNKVDIYSEEGQYLHLPRLLIIKHP